MSASDGGGRALALLPNPAAGGGKATRALPDVVATLDSLGVSHRTIAAESVEDARAEAARAGARGETVVAIGGDGLVGPVAGALRDAPGTLAVIPAGRGNDLARVLGIPRDPAEATRLAARGTERMIDVGEVNGVPFIGIASLGFDSDANRIANESRVVRGNLVYLYAALRALAAWRPASFEVEVDGELHTLSGYSVAVANSRAYGGGMFIAPRARLDDGRLDVVLLGDRPKLAALRHMPKLFKGTHVDDPTVSYLTGERIEVRADRPFMVYADGDPIAELPAVMTVSRRSLRVMAPAATGGVLEQENGTAAIR